MSSARDFFLSDGRLRLGSDVESYTNASGLAVYRPEGPALELIANYITPERHAASREEARRLGLAGELLRQIQDELINTYGSSWVEPDTNVLINLLLQKNDQGGCIPGFRLLQPYKDYHAPNRSTDVCDEIYQHLANGRIVILDLSVGDSVQRERLSKRIARHIYRSSLAAFNAGQHPPHITIYVEEAHNIIGRQKSLHEIWPTIAKEGAKARLAIVYATQEVSTIHPNSLANTENMIVSHLNKQHEIGELARCYNFDDFAGSLIRAQDVGFTRIKTLSNPFVIPVQIDRFDPEKQKQRSPGKK